MEASIADLVRTYSLKPYPDIVYDEENLKIGKPLKEGSIGTVCSATLKIGQTTVPLF